MWNNIDSEKTDNELMLEFKNCSRASFNIVFNRYKKRLFNFVLRGYLSDKDDAEEIVQKTFIKVYEYKYKYKPVYQFTTWIYTIAKNLAINELNRKKHFRIDEELTDSVLINESYFLEYDDTNKIIADLINRLKPKYKDIIVMRYLEELTYEEISLITGKNINTLKSLSKRGLEQIKVQLERCGIGKEKI